MLQDITTTEPPDAPRLRALAQDLDAAAMAARRLGLGLAYTLQGRLALLSPEARKQPEQDFREALELAANLHTKLAGAARRAAHRAGAGGAT